MSDNDNDNVVHLNIVSKEEELSPDERNRLSTIEVLEEMLERARAGDITELVATSVDADGNACIHVSSADWLGAVGLFEVGKHIFVTQYNERTVD